MARVLMFQGTGSDVGKTVLVAGLCRAARHRGLRVVPFKPQNMSNNAAVAEGLDGAGGEIGRGQWLQALAAGVPPHVDMNPVLLKPQSECGAQVVVQGRVHGTSDARGYQSLKSTLLPAALESFGRLCERADLVLVEGAGSPAETNLRDGDIANMGFAEAANVPVVVIGDIERGGVIASIVGTHTILPEADRARICGFVINKFRGDISLFDDGLEEITRFTGWRSFGVLPYVDAARHLPAEDSVALDHLIQAAGTGIKIAVPVLGRIANFDDLDPLRAEPDVSLVFVRKGEPIPADASLIILPGSKSTIGDMKELAANGWDRQIREHAANGGQVIGICGGYQMLGKSVRDPQGIEGEPGAVTGLGLLDIETELTGEKTVRTSAPRSEEFDCALEGYEIHLGETSGPDCARPMADLDGRADGAISANGRIRGCYLHGLFGSDAYRRELLASLGAETDATSHRQRVEDALDALAYAIETHLDVDGLLAVASKN